MFLTCIIQPILFLIYSKMKTSGLISLIWMLGITISYVQSSHFRGGTMSWRPTGEENKVSWINKCLYVTFLPQGRVKKQERLEWAYGLLHFNSIHLLRKILEKCTTRRVWTFIYLQHSANMPGEPNIDLTRN